MLADALEPATGRNATSNNMACITEASAGSRGFSARIPFVDHRREVLAYIARD